MNCTSLVVAFMAAASPFQSSSESSLREAARTAAERHFGEVEKARIDLWVERVRHLLAPSPADRRVEVEAALSSAAQYHSARLKSRLRQADQAGVLRPDLKAEGFQIEMDYLAARVERYLQRDMSSEAQELRLRQSAQILDAVDRALADRLPGRESRSVIERSLKPVREVWYSSLDTPFNSCLERPLAPRELAEVLGGIQGAANRFVAVPLSAADASDESRLAELGVTKMFNDVLEAAYRATGVANRDLAGFEDRRVAWQASLKDAIDRARAVKNAAAPNASPDPTPPRRAVGPAKIQPDAVPLRKPSPATTTGKVQDPPPSGTFTGTRGWLVAIAALVAATLIGYTLRRAA